MGKPLSIMDISRLHRLLASDVVYDVLRIHPNHAAAPTFVTPDSWRPWYNRHWKDLFSAVPDESVSDSHDNHAKISLLSAIHALQLPRDPVPLSISIPQPTFGMSPKKHHEVARMTQYIANLLHSPPTDLRIVDVGAGQGYLTRALSSYFNYPEILALDASHIQTKGAQSREARSHDAAHHITHRTIHITPDTLLDVVDEWVNATNPISPVPVLFVALHACGSLTTDILRAILKAHASPSSRPWFPMAAVLVGCCYNLMSPPSDFPLSFALSSLQPPINFPVSAYHLAAQIPFHWFDSEKTLADASFAIKKVAWRALLGRLSMLETSLTGFDGEEGPEMVGTGYTAAMRRLGRLPDSAYEDWSTFLRAACEKMGLGLSEEALTRPLRDYEDVVRNLETLHVMRCLLGPAIESLIILDRVSWVQERFDSIRRLGLEDRDFRIEAINLFDQRTGSGRNMALVIAPSSLIRNLHN